MAVRFVVALLFVALCLTALPSGKAPASRSPGERSPAEDRTDRDGDGLSDYAERVKYGTDPGAADTDKDGVPDGQWSERREFAYSVGISMKIRQPFDIEAMNDIYQDARIAKGPDEDGYTHIEAVLYPEARIEPSFSSFPPADLPDSVKVHTRPGLATTYDARMRSQVLKIVAGAETDVAAVDEILRWVAEETSVNGDSPIPEVYYTWVENGRVRLRGCPGRACPADSPEEAQRILETQYFADSMFEKRTHGTCTSVSTLRCAMIRAAGIPCRLIQTIFPGYHHEDQTEAYVNDLDRQWGCLFELSSGQRPMWVNHAFLEVLLGGRWARVDGRIGIRHQDPHCLSLKILAVSDWSQVDFSQTYPVDWIHDRPYYTLRLEDQEPKH